MCETVLSTIKRTLGDAVCARTWYGEFRELVLMCEVHNIKHMLVGTNGWNRTLPPSPRGLQTSSAKRSWSGSKTFFISYQKYFPWDS